MNINNYYGIFIRLEYRYLHTFFIYFLLLHDVPMFNGNILVN